MLHFVGSARVLFLSLGVDFVYLLAVVLRWMSRILMMMLTT